MKSLLATYNDTDNEEETGDGDANGLNQTTGSPEDSGSILHPSLQRAGSFSVTSNILPSGKRDSHEQLGLLGDSPEFEMKTRNTDEDINDSHSESENTEEGEMDSHHSASGKESLSGRVSSSSPSEEPPEKKMAMASENKADVVHIENNGAESPKSNSDRNHEVVEEEKSSSLARSMMGKLTDEIKLPPEPKGKCSQSLQDQIRSFLDYSNQSGRKFVEIAEKSKSFRNPSIYEKLVQYCNIDEKGTNFPPEVYDPYIWGKESYYEELNKVQQQDMARREKERGSRSQNNTTSASGVAMLGNIEADRKNRLSKWDSAGGSHHGHHSHSHGHSGQRPVVQVMSGTAKIIPATGVFSHGAFSSSSSLSHKHH